MPIHLSPVDGERNYRNGQVYRDIIDRMTGQRLDNQLIRTNHAKVMYDLPPTAIIKNAVVLHGGTITARNLPEGDTSKFNIQHSKL